MQYQLKYGDKCINIYAALTDVRKKQKTMYKHYGCLSRLDERDDAFYKALLRIDEQMVSRLCGFFNVLAFCRRVKESYAVKSMLMMKGLIPGWHIV